MHASVAINLRKFLIPIKLLLIYVLTVLPCLIFASDPVYASLPLAADGSTNTVIDKAANGVPLVNIAAPNAGGLSHNKYGDFNVNKEGLILNNAIGSKNGVIQTQLGGLVTDNPNLVNSGAASIILNEVTSNRTTQLNGYTEVAGKRADVIIANPNGISMAGAGFINVSRVTAIVGSSNQFNPNPNDLTFSLSNNHQINNGFLPKLTISGIGVDLESVSSTDLVASLMNIVAPIYGGNNEVNLRTGDKQFNYLTKQVTSDNTNPGHNAPDELAIDASSLAKIQAGKIYIVATKEGFGIKYSADLLASRNGVNIDAQGNINYNNIATEAGNIEITSRKGAITQNGIAQTKSSDSDIKLNAFDNITNLGQFLSARDISIETTKTFINQSSALNLSDNDFTIKALDVFNSGTLSAKRDFILEATTLTNSKEIVSGRNLTLTAGQITNDDSIFANNKITITATDFLTNNKDIKSNGTAVDDGIIINAKTLNNNKQISSKNNVTINSNIINNNTVDSLIIALKDIKLNVISLDNSSANIQAGNNLTLRNLTLNAPDIAALFSVTSQAISIANIGGSFSAGNGIDFDLGNISDYIIIGKLESSGFVKIKARNITNSGSVVADSYIKINAGNNFTNGSLTGDNSNIKFIAGTYLDITAANLISNYATLSSKTDLTLTSTNGNINNNQNAEIIGGSGKTTLSAKNGTVNQNSLHSLVSNGDLTLDVTDFDNTGRVDIAGNFVLNVANDLINEAYAMIYSGGNMTLNVVHNLTNNNGAAIYAEKNLTIQKYSLTNPLYNAANNKTSLVENISGQIISYDGDMRIDANILNNKRAISPFNSLLDPQTNGIIGVYYTTDQPQYWDNYRWYGAGGYCFGDNCQEKVSYYYARQLVNLESIPSSIQSGKTITFNTGELNNLASDILATGNITINADKFNNHSIKDQGLFATIGSFSGPDDYTEVASISPSQTDDYAGTSPSTIKSGGSITLNVTNDISNGDKIENSNSPITSKTPQLVNSKNVNDIIKNGIVDIDLTNYLNGPSDQGLFTKNPNPNGPLFETRSQFLDQSKFFGSDYFYQRIGLNLTDVQTNLEQQNKRMIGDQFFQTKIIEQQLQTITKSSLLLSATETNINNEIKVSSG